MALYIKADGLSGSVTAKGFEGWIECDYVTFPGIQRHVSTPTGGGIDRIRSAAKLADFILQKQVDASSVQWFEYANNAKVIPQLTIAYVKTGTDLTTYAQYNLTNVIVSHYSDTASAHQHAQEQIALNYDTIEKIVYPSDSRGIAQSPLRSGYNLAEAAIM